MTRSKRKSAARAQEPRAIEFDYDNAQWTEIEAYISEAATPWSTQERNSLPRHLRDIANASSALPAAPAQRRQLLTEAAVQYQSLARKRELGKYLPPRSQQELWKTLARRCGALRNDIEEALIISDRFKIDDPVYVFKPTVTKWSDALRTLAELKGAAEELSKPRWWATSIVWSFSGRREPSVVYVQRILMLWTIFGGKLKLSQHPVSGKISGPLERYLKAVTIPVMGSKAPKSISYRKLIERQKKLYRELVQIDRYLADQRRTHPGAARVLEAFELGAWDYLMSRFAHRVDIDIPL